MQGLRHKKLDFKSFPMTYYMLDFDNRARNGDRLKFTVIFSTSSLVKHVTGPQYCRIKHATGPWYMIRI